MKRRSFLKLSLTFSMLYPFLNGCKQFPKKINGKIIGASSKIGHLLRKEKKVTPTTTSFQNIVIVGGGISGLSAGYWLKKNNIEDFTILDLEKNMGGNASYGSNGTSLYPLGAHYIPIPNNNLKEYIAFLNECQVITSFTTEGIPIYNEFYLCSDPQERLFINGQWQDGVVPKFGLTPNDTTEIKRFFDIVNSYKFLKGTDDKYIFSIPIDTSSNDEAFKKLDEITMLQWLHQNNFNSKYLHWYVNYCTRDDFGTPLNIVSAWAGLHYFASRKGIAANATNSDIITWPNGNGWLSDQLQKNIKQQLKNNALVVNIEQYNKTILVTYFDVTTATYKAIECNHCIVATPQFINSKILSFDDQRKALIKKQLNYVPWMVANIEIKKQIEKEGAPLSWDNVLLESDSLGYVEATHQLIEKPDNTVLTYYLPLTNLTPAESRKISQEKKFEDWSPLIIEDLKKVYPNIEDNIINIDITIWGHAMAQPLPGLIFGDTRKILSASINNIHFAHTDLAGISIFEEAFYQGINAANKIIL